LTPAAAVIEEARKETATILFRVYNREYRRNTIRFGDIILSESLTRRSCTYFANTNSPLFHRLPLEGPTDTRSMTLCDFSIPVEVGDTSYNFLCVPSYFENASVQRPYLTSKVGDLRLRT